MKIESNKRALLILLMLVATAVLIFLMEKKILIKESRGSTLSMYGSVKGVDNIMLLIEDFEGLNALDSAAMRDSVLKSNGFWDFGSAKIRLDKTLIDNDPMASKSALMIEWEGTDKFGGWGKGVGANIELDPLTAYINFRVYFPESNLRKEKIKIILAEDDNEDAALQDDLDDSWEKQITITEKNQWQLISVSLKDFADGNKGGDGVLNITRRGGLHTITFVLDQPEEYVQGQKWYFDFINISDKTLNNNVASNN